MAWTLPTTVTDGMAMTAANFNAWVTENLKFLKGVGGATATLDGPLTLGGPLTLPAAGALAIGTLMWALRTSKGQNYHVDGGVVTFNVGGDGGGQPQDTSQAVTFTRNFGSNPAIVPFLATETVVTGTTTLRISAWGVNGFTLVARTNNPTATATRSITVCWIAFGQSAGGL